MPDGDAYEFIRALRRLAPEQGGLVPAIATSAAENMQAALMAGFHVFLPKPFDWEALVEIAGDFCGPGKVQRRAPWTLSAREHGRVVLTFTGRVEAGDMRALTLAVVVLLEQGPVDIACNLRADRVRADRGERRRAGRVDRAGQRRRRLVSCSARVRRRMQAARHPLHLLRGHLLCHALSGPPSPARSGNRHLLHATVRAGSRPYGRWPSPTRRVPLHPGPLASWSPSEPDRGRPRSDSLQLRSLATDRG